MSTSADRAIRSEHLSSERRRGLEEADELVRRLTGRALFLEHRGEVKSPDLMRQAAAALTNGRKLWLWRNGPDRFLAFDSLFPTMPDSADPATLGQPAGYAYFHPMTLAEAQAISHAAWEKENSADTRDGAVAKRSVARSEHPSSEGGEEKTDG